MKAISLWQPWASAIAVGSKHIETRSWPTNYRGPIAIHAGKKGSHQFLGNWLTDQMVNWPAVLFGMGIDWHADCSKFMCEVLPFGMIIATANLIDCEHIEKFPSCVLNEDLGGWRERDLGDFAPGRFGWVLEDVHRLETPVPCVGRQGLFNIDDSILD